MVETPFNPEETPDESGQAAVGEVAGNTADAASEIPAERTPEPADVTAAETAAEPAPASGPVAAGEMERQDSGAGAGSEPSSEAPNTNPITIAELIPEPIPTPPQPAPSAAATAGAEPSIASVLEVPPLAPAGAEGEADGGEWELLIGKLQTWFHDLSGQWDRIRGPLKGIAILVAVVIALRTYAALVGTIDSIPLISGLLELVGVIAFGRFTWDKLLRSGERQKLLSDWRQRWSDFSGRN
jgi:hypothetical protein